MSDEDLDSLTYLQLKEKCLMAGVEARGTKKDLLIALRAHLSSRASKVTLSVLGPRIGRQRSQTVSPQNKHKPWNSSNYNFNPKPVPTRSIPKLPQRPHSNNNVLPKAPNLTTHFLQQPMNRKQRSQSIGNNRAKPQWTNHSVSFNQAQQIMNRNNNNNSNHNNFHPIRIINTSSPTMEASDDSFPPPPPPPLMMTYHSMPLKKKKKSISAPS